MVQKMLFLMTLGIILTIPLYQVIQDSMDIPTLISFVGLALTIIGGAVTFGRVYQKQNDLSRKMNHVERTIATIIATAVTDGNRITSLEAKHDQILASLAEIKSDIRLFLNKQ